MAEFRLSALPFYRGCSSRRHKGEEDKRAKGAEQSATYYPSTSSSKKFSSLSAFSIIFCIAGGSFSRWGSFFGSNGEASSAPAFLLGSAGVSLAGALGSLLSELLLHHILIVVEELSLDLLDGLLWKEMARLYSALVGWL